MRIDEILAERQTTHGEYTEHAAVTQETLQLWMRRIGWEKLTNVQRESLHMIAHKVGRILCGDPNHKDSWSDICGYSQLAADRIRVERYPVGPGTPEDGGHHERQLLQPAKDVWRMDKREG